MGDGILVYFGYPRAHEDEAERSVRAGLDIVDAMAELNAAIRRPPGVELAVRIGIATGPVIVGDQVGEGTASETAVVGETPNLVARLQALAQPNQIVVSAATRAMLGDHFDLEDLGAYELKGFAEPAPAWRILSARDVESRFAATRTGSSAPLVGRQEEMGLLLRAWEGSCHGRGQVVLIQGEAGVGKSRLVEGLRETTAKDHIWVAIRCSPFHTASAFHPIVEHLKRVFGWQPEDTAPQHLAKLEAGLAGFRTLPLSESVRLFADLMSVPLPEDRYPRLSMTAQRQRDATLDAIVSWLIELAEGIPVLMAWEDLHWADPTTLEALGMLIEQAPTAALLVVATYRPELTPPWPQRSHMTPITLNRLERPEVEAMVGHLAGGRPLHCNIGYGAAVHRCRLGHLAFYCRHRDRCRVRHDRHLSVRAGAEGAPRCGPRLHCDDQSDCLSDRCVPRLLAGAPNPAGGRWLALGDAGRRRRCDYRLVASPRTSRIAALARPARPGRPRGARALAGETSVALQRSEQRPLAGNRGMHREGIGSRQQESCRR